MKTHLPFLALILVACSSSTTATKSAPEQACLDTADAFGKAAQRCGQPYKASYDAFVQAAAKGDCANTIQVRDEASLRSACLPSFATVSCADLAAGTIDPSCRAQLIHAASVAPAITPTSRFADIGAEE